MSTTIDWGSKVITVYRADLLKTQDTPIEIRRLVIDDFRMELNALQASEEGMWADTTHEYFPPVTVSGVALARVVNIINGYTVTFEDGLYAVDITGGNSNISDVVNINNVAVRSANSAGLMDIQYMQAAAFDGVVAIDITSDYTGVAFPVGTKGFPVNNLTDAHSIANQRGINTFLAMKSMTLDEGDFSEGHTFSGINASTVVITIADAAEISNCEFRDCAIQGILDNSNILRDCAVYDITHINGFIHQCALFGTVTLGGELQAMIMDCYSGIAGGGPEQYPHVDMGGAGNSLALRGYSGGLGISNSSGLGTSSLDFDSGRVIFEDTCTGGEFTVRGVCDVEDNSDGATINDLTINLRLDNSTLAEELTQEQAEAEVITDDVNGLLIRRNTRVQRRWEADAWEDTARTQRYRGKGLAVAGQLVEVAWS